jgi:membrane-associated phospholipid phosphatase
VYKSFAIPLSAYGLAKLKYFQLSGLSHFCRIITIIFATLNRIDTYWLTSLFFILFTISLAIFLPNVEPTHWANSHNSAFMDFFFKWYTQIGEWPIISAALLLALMKHWKVGLLLAICYALDLIVVNGTKILVGATRPIKELGIGQLHQIPGVVIHSYQSFPSGHTAASFIGFGFISTLFPNKWFKFTCSMLAFLVAYPRLYLGQHYLKDVLAGAIIALLILGLYLKFYDRFHLIKTSQ